MAISKVHVTADVFMVCLNHALVTEKEEVMGLLIGEIDEERVSHISAIIMLQRSDKRKDRVEISPEQLSDASTRAEFMRIIILSWTYKLAVQLDKPMRVLGWYHSHPHITVWPSHVDVQTQAMYQMMDEGFVGLIFSVFNEEKTTKQGRVQLACFQSINQSPEGEIPQFMRLEIPVHIIPSPTISNACLDALVELPSIICEEEQDTYNNACCISNIDVITQIHNSAIFTKSLCHITEVMSVPLMQMLENRFMRNQEILKRLQLEKKQLQDQLR